MWIPTSSADGHTNTAITSLEEHINRFVGKDKRYDIRERDFAILHYQVEGTVPLVAPIDPNLSEVFAKRVLRSQWSTKLYSGVLIRRSLLFAEPGHQLYHPTTYRR